MLARIQRMLFAYSTRSLWGLVFLSSLVLYLFTAQRNISWQDSGMFQWRVLTADYSGTFGLALAHPLYILAAQLLTFLPTENLAWKLNAFSGIGTAIALANFACLVRLLNVRTSVSLAVTAMLALTHAVWWLSTIAEVYTWVLAGLTGELWLVLKLLHTPHWKTATSLGFVNGLGFSLHNFALLPLPVYFGALIYLVWQGRLPKWTLYSTAAAFVIGGALYLGMIGEFAFRTGQISSAINSALFGDFRSAVVNTGFTAGYWKVNAALAALSFCNILVPLAIVGWWNISFRLQKPAVIVLIAVTIIELLFVVRYPVPDQFTFILPTLVMVAAAAAIGLNALLDVSPNWGKTAFIGCTASLLCMPLVYAFLPTVLAKADVEVQRARKLPFRDELRYWIVPWKQDETSARRFAEAALKQAGPNGVILADETSVFPLMLLQHQLPEFRDITMQYAGRPLPLYDWDPVEFRRATAGRSVYTVSPVRGYMPGGMEKLLKDAQFTRSTSDVLYLVQ